MKSAHEPVIFSVDRLMSREWMQENHIQQKTGKLQPVVLEPGLYLVATPIGNLRDITLRGLDVLSGADAVACEDTRMTGKLLSAFGIKKTMIVYNDHTNDRQRGSLLEKLAAGARIALVSDAGMPLISDPGYKLVRDCADLGIMVTSIPGANAPLTALQLSGLPTDRFTFMGFLPPKSAARRAALSSGRSAPGTLIFFETAPRLLASLRDMLDILGDRPAAVVREITKKFEEARRASFSQLIAHYESEGAPKGEIVIVVGDIEQGAIRSYGDDELKDKIRAGLGSYSLRETVDRVSLETSMPRNHIYDLALEVKKE